MYSAELLVKFQGKQFHTVVKFDRFEGNYGDKANDILMEGEISVLGQHGGHKFNFFLLTQYKKVVGY